MKRMKLNYKNDKTFKDGFEEFILNCKAKSLLDATINHTITEVETLMTKENLTKLQVVNENDEVYGIYNNLICDSITKNLIDATINANLSKIDETQVKIAELQKTVDILVVANLGV